MPITLSPADLSLVEKYRPNTLGDVLGQSRAVKKLKGHVARPVSKAFLLHGPSGTGKTSAALAMARDLGVVVEDGPFGGFFEVKAGEQSIDTLRDLLRKVPVAHGFGYVGSGHKLVLVEEADRCSKEVATWWLGAIEEIKRNVPKCTIVFTTNHYGKLDARLRSRFSDVPFEGGRDQLIAAADDLIKKLWVAETGRTDNAPGLNEFPEITINDDENLNIRALVEQFEDYLIENEIGRKQIGGLVLASEPAAATTTPEPTTVEVQAVETPSSGFSEVDIANAIANLNRATTKEAKKTAIRAIAELKNSLLRHDKPLVCKLQEALIRNAQPVEPIKVTTPEPIIPPLPDFPTLASNPADPFATIVLDVSRDDYNGTARDVATLGSVDVSTEQVGPANVVNVMDTEDAQVVIRSRPEPKPEARPATIETKKVAPPSSPVFGKVGGKKPRKGSLDAIGAVLDRNNRLADHARANPGKPIHPFTLAGLGTVPFKHLESYDLGRIADFCDCCGTPIRFVATIESSEGKTSKIGHVCLDRHAKPASQPAELVAC